AREPAAQIRRDRRRLDHRGAARRVPGAVGRAPTTGRRPRVQRITAAPGVRTRAIDPRVAPALAARLLQAVRKAARAPSPPAAARGPESSTAAGQAVPDHHPVPSSRLRSPEAYGHPDGAVRAAR